MKIKLLPRDGEHRTQEETIEFHNQRKEKMLSMPDVFQIVNENNTEAIESLRKDFKYYWLVTSTRIIYNKNNLSAKIIHDADSEVVKQKEIDVKEIPDYTNEKLKDVIDSKVGLEYIRALLNAPKATKEQLIKFFVELSGKKESKIKFWTPTQSSRKDKKVRSVGLCFGVLGYLCFDYGDGFSRGVIVSSAKQTKIFSNKAIFDIEEKTITIPLQKKIHKDIERKLSKNKKVKIEWRLKIKIR